MDEPRNDDPPLARWARRLTPLALAFVVLAMLLPRSVVRWLRIEVGPFNWAMTWAELASRHANLVHVVLFAAAAFLLAARRDLKWKHILLGLLVLGTLTELAQFVVPTRTPRWSDVADDLVGAALGLLFALALRSLADWMRRRRDAAP